MPRVPTYQEQQTLRPLANVPARATRSPLENAGAALQQAGETFGNIALRQQHQQNVQSVMQAETALKDSYREFETAALERQGTNAWGVTGEAETWFERNLPKIEKTLANDEQRSVFRQQAQALRQQSLKLFARHESQHRQAAVEESTKASIAGSIDLAARRASDPEAVATARSDVLRRVDMLATTNGWTPERHEIETHQTLTALHQQVLENLADADPAAARAYLDTNADDIDATRLDDFGRLVKTAELRATAQAATDEIVGAGVSESEALARARREYEGEARDEIVRRVKTRYSEDRAAAQQREREVADEAWNIFARTGKVESIPTPLLDELDGRTLQALKKEEAGGPEETDWDHYYALRSSAFENPAAFVRRDLRQDFPRLRPTERRFLISMQDTLRAPKSFPDAASTERQLGIVVTQLGLKDKRDIARLQNAAYVEIEQFTRQAGRPPTYNERQEIIDRVIISGEVIGGGLWGFTNPERRLFEVYGTDDMRAFRADIPASDREKIIGALERHGRPVNEAAIVDTWLRRQAKGAPSMADAAELAPQLSAARRLVGLRKPEDKAKFDAVAHQVIDAEQRRVGRKLSNDERQEIIDLLTVDGEVIGGGAFGLVDPDRYFYEVAGTADVDAFRARIPAREREQVVKALEDAGRPVNELAVIELWLRARREAVAEGESES